MRMKNGRLEASSGRQRLRVKINLVADSVPCVEGETWVRPLLLTSQMKVTGESLVQVGPAHHVCLSESLFFVLFTDINHDKI